MDPPGPAGSDSVGAKVGYLKLSEFNAQSKARVLEALQQLNSRGASSLARGHEPPRRPASLSADPRLGLAPPLLWPLL